MKWKSDWPRAKEDLTRWWNRKGMALRVDARADKQIELRPDLMNLPTDPYIRGTDVKLRCDGAEYNMVREFFGGVGFPVYQAITGPGTLAECLGCKAVFEPDTVWYEPCIFEPDKSGPIKLSRENNAALDLHVRMVEEGLRRGRDKYLVAMPDLIENLDILAAMRGSENLLMDLVERPSWVKERNWEINQAFFEAFDIFFDLTKFEGGNPFIFGLWGPGKTCKVQCDFSCMISPAMFKEFVVPCLTAQCDWLDYSMYHLDGETALQHLNLLLEIDSLDAIEWTPMGAAGQSNVSHTGGHPQWYDLYRRIKAGGKSVQAVGVKAAEVKPLVDAVGPEGMFIWANVSSQREAEKLLADMEQYR
jgi:hypothetical protein